MGVVTPIALDPYSGGQLDSRQAMSDTPSPPAPALAELVPA